MDRAFWIAIRRVWPEWANALIIVIPETVIRWHRAGFKNEAGFLRRCFLYNREWIRIGSRCVDQETAAILECTDKQFLPEGVAAGIVREGGRQKLQERLTALRRLVESL